MSFVVTIVAASLVVIMSEELILGHISRHDIRLPDIRMLNEEYRLPYIERFLSRRLSQDKRYIIILGDSQFYGADFPEDQIFSGLLQSKVSKDGYEVINLAMTDGRAIDMSKIIGVIGKLNIKVSHYIYNFDLAHYSKIYEKDFGRLSSYKKLPAISFFYAHTMVINYLKKILSFTIFQKAEPKLKMEIENAGRYDTDHERNDHNFAKLVQDMRSNCQNPMIVFSPHCQECFQYSHFDATLFTHDIIFYGNLARKQGVPPIDLTFSFEKNNFIDIIHLNLKGHLALSNVLSDHINQTKNNLGAIK